MIASENNLQKELDHIQKVFCEINDYPERLTKKIITEEVNRQPTPHSEEATTEETEEQEKIHLNLPYAGKQGQLLMRKLSKNILTTTKGKVQLRTTFTPCKLGSKFSVKDKTELIHQHNVTYHISCANKRCEATYVGETKRRILTRMMEHNSKDPKSHVLIHSKETKHRQVFLPNLKIVGSGYKSDFRRKISEALHIKELKPDLNVQKDAYRLKLYN